MASPSPNFLLDRERERNQSTRGEFAASSYAEHRARQMALLDGLRGQRIAILGAGNCNDVELSRLARAFGEVHLFDFDGEALRSAIAGQDSEVRGVCHLHEWDLTGVASFLVAWRDNPPEPMTAQIAAWNQLSPLVAEAGEFDVVMSTCMLSQVAINLRDFFGVVPALNSALSAAIVGHVVLTTALAKPGGAVFIVSDTVTSKYPIHEETERRGALGAIFHFESQGAAFPGTEPGLIRGVLSGADVTNVELKGAWLWNLRAEQQYLVYAVGATRRVESA